MIHKFIVENFQSIDEPLEISFLVDDKIPDSNRYFRSESGNRASLVTALIGPNAVGKTTALRALSFIRWLFVSSFYASHYDEGLPFTPFAGKSGRRLTRLAVEFELEDSIYEYRVVIRKTRITEEQLSERSKVTKRFTTKKLFTRRWDRKTQSYAIVDDGFGLPEGYWRSNELKCTSLIAAAAKFGHQHATKLVGYWRNVQSNVEDDRYYRPASYSMYDALRYFDRDKETKKNVERDAKRYADLGINAFNSGRIRHKYGDIEFDLDPDQESSGTRNYISMYKMIKIVLDNGGIAIIDEFDAYLHFNMFKSLLNMFFEPSINKRGGQLLLTTHNLGIFSIVDPKHQILLAEKNNNGSTVLYKIKDRPDANFLQKYLGGYYGALPTIHEENFEN